MRQLLVLQGLPGSGKTTFAKEQVEAAKTEAFGAPSLKTVLHTYKYPAVTRVNRDEIRAELSGSGWVWSPDNEKQDVIPLRDGRIAKAFAAGAETVIVDDTNFGRKTITHLSRLAKECDAEFVIKRFNIPVAECIRRDSLRTGKARVGEHVIRRMAREHGIESTPDPLPDLVKYVVPSYSVPKAIICDLDGTLSLFMEKGHRGPYNQERCSEDDCHKTIRRLLEMYYRFMGYEIIYLSGRSATYRPQTEEFLRKNHCPPGSLFMRAEGDSRKDWIIKYELFNANIREKYDVELALDDRDQCVKLWRSIGLTCFQVNDGAF